MDAPSSDLDAVKATVKQLATELLHRDSQLAGKRLCIAWQQPTTTTITATVTMHCKLAASPLVAMQL